MEASRIKSLQDMARTREDDAAHRSTSVLDKLVEQYRVQEVKLESRRTQKESDEQATQLWRSVHGLNP